MSGLPGKSLRLVVKRNPIRCAMLRTRISGLVFELLILRMFSDRLAELIESTKEQPAFWWRHKGLNIGRWTRQSEIAQKTFGNITADDPK